MCIFSGHSSGDSRKQGTSHQEDDGSGRLANGGYVLVNEMLTTNMMHLIVKILTIALKSLIILLNEACQAHITASNSLFKIKHVLGGEICTSHLSPYYNFKNYFIILKDFTACIL